MITKRLARLGMTLLALVGLLIPAHALRAQEDLAPEVENGQVVFSCLAPGAGAVYLAGSFNGWNAQANLMKQGDDGVWRLSLSLSAGRHEYKFVIDGNWTIDPNAHDTGPDGYGGENAILVLTGSGERLKIVIPEKGKAAPVEAAVEKSALPYVSGRYVSALLTRRDPEDDNRFGLIKPEHDIRLDISVEVSSGVSAWVETRINTIDDDPTLKLHRAHIMVDATRFSILPYHNELLVEFDDPLTLVGKIGDMQDPFGENTQGIVLTSSAISSHTLGMAKLVGDEGTELLAFYADDEKEVDRTGLRLKVGQLPSVGISFLRVKPVQAVPVLDERTIAAGVNEKNWTFLPSAWWRQFYHDWYDSTGSDTRSWNVEHYFHFTEFEVDREADKTYAADLRVPLLSENLIFYGEVALRRYPSLKATSDVHTFKSSTGAVEYDTSTVIFNEKYDVNRFVGGILARPNEAFQMEISYELEKGQVHTNLGQEIDDPVKYEPQITLLKCRARWQAPPVWLLEEPEITLLAMLEDQKIIDGFIYGEHWAFYEYPRYNRYGYLNNFHDLYLRNVKQTLTLQSILAFKTMGDWRCSLDGKYHRYTMEKLALGDGDLVWENLYLETGEIILETAFPLTRHVTAGANCRFQIYALSTDQVLYFRNYYGNPYLEVAYHPSPKVRLGLAWGVNPIDQFDRYRRSKGRVDFLVQEIDEGSDVPNYGRDNEYKLELVRRAENALENEHRLTVTIEVNF
ncbi:glycogen-binding domain-containing protein [bacterium]|nr:glycogen-binding domain-containing protein [bacterium]